MLTIDSLSTDLSGYLVSEQIGQVRRAYDFAERAHGDQKRHSGDPYITHPLAVAAILADMHMDHQCLMAALLHDVIEDTGVAKHTLGKEFDNEVADLVDGVSKLNNIFESRAHAQAENFQKMTLAMAKDVRVILVKLADRLHNMRTLGALSREKRRRIAKETLEIYAPIANRLGMNAIRIEFEELGFKALYPLRASMIERAVRRARGNRREVVSQILTSLEATIGQENIEAEVFGREKHLYSIYDKMRAKHRSFTEIMDVYAFRIVVSDVDTCYRTLGVVHNLYKPVAGRFKDYIAIPKVNGYQSLHTTLFGMHGIPIEIQIRTVEMDAVANNGIAGHWLYKTGDDAQRNQNRAREWMKGLLEIQQSTGNSMEFIENVKMDLFPNEVYIFSPLGEIFNLPQGATPVDFAYAVHTDIGNTCVACRIDRRLAPLSTTLESGQTVEIVNSPGAGSNPAWLSFVITGKARSGIRDALKNREKSESVSLGRRLLERAMRSLNASLDTVDDDSLADTLAERSFQNFDELLEAIGLGNQMAALIARRLLAVAGDADASDTHASSPVPHPPLAIRGTEGVVVQFAKCCRPIPGDPITGHLSAGRGIVVHMEGCRNVHEFGPKKEETVAVRWESELDQEFAVDLRCEFENGKGMIAVLASTIATADASIERISLTEKDAHLGTVLVTLGAKSRDHLAKIIKRIRTIKGIHRIVRARN